jgi:hypothetical protein
MNVRHMSVADGVPTWLDPKIGIASKESPIEWIINSLGNWQTGPLGEIRNVVA